MVANCLTPKLLTIKIFSSLPSNFSVAASVSLTLRGHLIDNEEEKKKGVILIYTKMV